jgi:hypothetical protein
MSAVGKNYMEQLSSLRTQFYLVLERYKQSFIAAHAEGNAETNTNFQNNKALLESSFNNIFLLEQQIQRSVDANDEIIQGINEEVSLVKGILGQENQVLREKKGSGLAAKPLEKQIDQALITQYVSLGYYVFAIAIAMNFAYKQYK